MLTEASGCVYSPTDFTDAHRFLGCVFAPNLCTSVQSVGVFIGGYGILPYPRHPLRGCSSLCCTNRANRAYPPTEFTEFTEASGREYSPTDFTDAHRLGGYGILPYPRYPLPILPQNSPNSQKLLAEDILPRISQMPTDLEGMASCHTHATLCQFSHRIHGIHRSFWRKIFSHGFHRCSQMVRLRRVLWLLWEDSLVAAWVWQDAIPS